MRKLLATVGILALSFSLACPGPARANEGFKGPDEDGTKPALTKIAGEGFMNSHAYEYLTELSDNVGARVTGTTEAQKAIDWGIAKMRAIGLENVHAEKWQLWRGWKRGTAEAELLSPTRHKLHVDAMGWTGSTPAGGVEGEVVAVNMFDLDQEIKDISRLKGKVALVVAQGNPKKGGDMLFVQFGDFLRAAQKAGVLAVIGGQGGAKAAGLNLTHTGILGFDADFEIPVVSMTAEDQGQLERYVDAEIKPRARFNIQNTFTNGPVESANVVGEIRGRQNPEQVFVVGAHLDSWDLSEGSTDNGFGSASVLGAADAIVRSGMKPRRTIRFVLFTGEEQGLDGSFAYVKEHQKEMANHLGDLVLDEGQGPVSDFQLGGRDDLVASFRPFSKSLANIREIKVNEKVESGTDTLPFSVAGLPGINMNQDSPDYTYTHHSAADALEAVKPEVLTQNATLMAMTAFWIADRPERFAAPWPAERTAKMLREQGQYDILRAFNLWPYGDLGTGERKKED
ncbi:MAG TPA: M28 family peptidase [Candidatus Saccharimonadales bacterium]|jgi:carboxypeptidase Q|nr:M28 family peptidase [Candidatus Saccharimonadales bacterium]